ncbi:MAG: PQQ-binding-like beta-propeller repeat protein [Gemmatimonadota bacterium]
MRIPARGLRIATASLLLAACSSEDPAPRAPAAPIEWPNFGGDLAATRWSTADDITPDNVDQLRPAWRWRNGEYTTFDPVTSVRLAPGAFEATPLMVGDTLYFTTPFSRAVALDAISGRELWAFDPHVTRSGLIANDHSGFVHRGVALWEGDGARRVFLNARWRLYALDATTGRPVPSFGEAGVVDLTRDLRWPVNPLHFGQTSPPLVWRDIVIVGSSIADAVQYERDPPGDVQAFDARTGKRLWRWDPLPPLGARGDSSWGGEAADRTGHSNVWPPMSLDTARGLVYLPVGAASNDFYGGRRPGNNRWSQSIVCLNARTGALVWGRQLVHHGLWDYDPPAAPMLLTVQREGIDIPVVALAGKTGFLYILNRLTGEPLWPMDERPVPSSDVPGEVASATQPFPSFPVPFAPQGMADSSLVHFTPEILAQARNLVRHRRMGPLFTPPSIEGTVALPGWIGGAGWGGMAANPERGVVFVKATNSPSLLTLVPSSAASGYQRDRSPESISRPITIELPVWRTWGVLWSHYASLPIVNPPYGTLSAYSVASGERLWQVTLGDLPEVRNHPMLRNLKLPPLGVPGAPGGVATRGGLIFITGGGTVLYAIDQRDGSTRWSFDLGITGYSNPMTYRAGDGRQYVVVATGAGNNTELRAFVLPAQAVPGGRR